MMPGIKVMMLYMTFNSELLLIHLVSYQKRFRTDCTSDT